MQKTTRLVRVLRYTTDTKLTTTPVQRVVIPRTPTVVTHIPITE